MRWIHRFFNNYIANKQKHVWVSNRKINFTNINKKIEEQEKQI